MNPTMVEKCISAGIIDEVRQNLGAKDENDDSKDDIINGLTPTEVMERWSEWEIGDSFWARKMIRCFVELSKP